MNCDAFKDRLKIVMDGESVRGFARRMNLSEGVVRQYLSGASLPGLDKLISISEESGVRLEWLAEGTGQKWRDQGGCGDMNATGAVGVVQVGHGSGNKITQNHAPNGGGSMVVDRQPEYLPDELRELNELISKYGSPAIVAEFKRKLLKIKEITEG